MNQVCRGSRTRICTKMPVVAGAFWAVLGPAVLSAPAGAVPFDAGAAGLCSFQVDVAYDPGLSGSTGLTVGRVVLDGAGTCSNGLNTTGATLGGTFVPAAGGVPNQGCLAGYGFSGSLSLILQGGMTYTTTAVLVRTAAQVEVASWSHPKPTFRAAGTFQPRPSELDDCVQRAVGSSAWWGTMAFETAT
jgi:hypothetical protein